MKETFQISSKTVEIHCGHGFRNKRKSNEVQERATRRVSECVEERI